MHTMTAAQAEQHLTDLVDQFAQWRQQRTGGERVHDNRQQRDADDRKAAAKSSLHEGNQEGAGQRDNDSGKVQLQEILSISRDVSRPAMDMESACRPAIPVVPTSRDSTVAETDCTEINLHRVGDGTLRVAPCNPRRRL